MRACVCVCKRKTKDRADGMSKKKCPFPSTGSEPVPLGHASIVLLITPQEQAYLASDETNTSDTDHQLHRETQPSTTKLFVCVCVYVCVCVCVSQ